MYQGFPNEMLSLIRCPKDAGVLVFQGNDAEDFITGGAVACCSCNNQYEIRDGILGLLDVKDLTSPVSAQEIIARNMEAEIYHTFGSERDEAKEISSTIRNLGNVTGKIVVDLGCGTGRILVHLLGHAQHVIGVDFSIDSLKVLARKIDGPKNVGLILADATKFRAQEEAFDIVLSTQVLEHLPSIPARPEFYRLVKRLLKTGGIFVCTVYYQNIYCRLRRSAPDGFHDSGIYYHRFGKRELKKEVGYYFRIQELHPILIHIPFSRRFNMNDTRISIKMERIPIFNSLGELLLVRAENSKP